MPDAATLVLSRSLLTVLAGAAAAAPPQQQHRQEPPPQQSPSGQALQHAIAAAQARIETGLSLWADHSTWDKAWLPRTEHFVVRTTRSYGEGLDIARGLETMLAHFQSTLGVAHTPAAPLQVFVFPDLAAYNQFGTGNGDYHSSFYGTFYAPGHADKPVAAVWSDNPVWLRMQITHSVAHQYLDSLHPGGKRPVWLEEGLAAYFSIYWDYGWSLQEYERFRDYNGLPHLKRLLRDGLDAYALDTHARMMELGMMFYWLLRYREDTRTTLPGEAPSRAPFRDYLRALLEGRPTQGLLCERLLADPEQLERDLRDFEFPR